MTHLAEKPGDDVAENDRLVRFVIVGRGRDACEVPEVALPLVEARVLAAGVEEEDVWSALDEPTTVKDLDSCCAHAVEGGSEVGVSRLLSLDLHGGGLVGERTDEGIAIAILGDCNGYLYSVSTGKYDNIAYIDTDASSAASRANTRVPGEDRARLTLVLMTV